MSECTGLFIPKEIKYLKDILTPNQILLMAYIYNFNSHNNDCFASNSHIAEEIMCTETRIPKLISGLKKLGFLNTKTVDGRRYLFVDMEYTLKTSAEEREKAQAKKANYHGINPDAVSENSQKSKEEPKAERATDLALLDQKEDANGKLKELKEQTYNIVYNLQKKDNISEKLEKTCFSSDYKKAIAEIIFIWNEFKKENEDWIICRECPETNNAIIENLKDGYTSEEICIAISNYFTVFTEPKYFWNYSWPLYKFLTVRDEKKVTSPRKWYQFKEDNFIPKNYLSRSYVVIEQDLNKSLDVSLTKRIIKSYGWRINDKEYMPTIADLPYFIEATAKMIDYYKDKKLDNKYWVKNFMDCVEKHYQEECKKPLMPYHLADERSWGIIFPQYLKSEGVYNN